MTTWWIILFVCCWGAVLMLATAVLGLMRRIQELETGRLLTQATTLPPVQGPRVGAPLAATPGLASGPGIDTYGMLLFLSSNCGACIRLKDSLRENCDRHPLDMEAVTIVTDTEGESVFANLEVAQIIVQQDREILQSLGIPATPYALVVSASGTIVSAGLAPDLDALGRLTGALEVEGVECPNGINALT